MLRTDAGHWKAASRGQGRFRPVKAIAGALMSLLSLSTLYLLTLLGAAAIGKRRHGHLPEVSDDGTMNVVVIVPAHNEEAGIARTVQSLRDVDYAPDRFEILVIADNCTDRTAEYALAARASVLVRTDVADRGKGFALAWGIERVLHERPDAGAIVIVDADCTVSTNILASITARLQAGAPAVQVNNVVANPEESWSAALRYAAFSLIDTVRPLGKTTIGLSCGLYGTGMGFARSTLEAHPWSAVSLAEDGEYHLRLVKAGQRVVFAPEAFVSSAMPASLKGAQDQHLRWEGGRWDLIRRVTPSMIRRGLSQRDANQIHAGLEPLIPPQALLFAANVATPILSILMRSRALGILAIANLAAQTVYVVGGLLLVGAPRHVFRALLFAPLLMIWKLGVWFRVLLARQSPEWVRTSRAAR
jgi:cellulose synthase/poly-beta-1,6-N-acetylglucosamine synthase-like glycosyltransferase